MFGLPRHRDLDPLLTTGNWEIEFFAQTTAGSCTASPGPMTRSIASLCRSGSSPVAENSGSMDDIVTKEYDKLVAQGKIVNNPMSSTYSTYVSSIVSWDYTYHLSKYGCDPARYYAYGNYYQGGTESVRNMIGGIAYEFIDAPVVDVESLQDKAILKAWSRVGHDKMLALATMAEMGKSISGLVYLFKKVYKIRRAIKRADLKKLKKEISWRELEEIYMNARYNLRPLYYDTKGIIDIITNVDKPERQTFRARASENEKASDVLPITIVDNVYISMKVDAYRSCAVETEVRAGVLTNAQRANLSQLLGLDSIVATSWDLLPLSFILDWFVNVGDVLTAWSPKVGFHALASWVSTNQLFTYKTSLGLASTDYTDYNGYYHDVGPEFNFGGGSSSAVVKNYDRIANYERPLLPSFDVSLSAFKILDLAIITKKIFMSEDIHKYR